VPVLKIGELDDVKIWFYHYAVSRQIPEGMEAATGKPNPRRREISRSRTTSSTKRILSKGETG